MKTYLPQIERRILVRPNQPYGILNYDLDNAYPQRMLELVGQSPTAKDCWNKRAKYIGGKGFEKEELAKVVLNSRGLTMAKLLTAISKDKGLFTGFGIHINYNANYKISSVNYVKFEDIRLGDTDANDTKNKFAIYSDWGKKTWKNIMRSKIAFVDKYNPDPDVIKQQVIDAGGWDKYKGQLFYFNPEVDDYPLIEADSVGEDFETEANIKVFNNREVTTGFLPSAMLFMQSRREEADNKPAQTWQDGTPREYTGPTDFEQNLGSFQGAKESNKIIVIEYDDPEAKPDLKAYQNQNNDKLFESTTAAVENRIIKGFSIPKELVTSDTRNGLSNGGEKKEAIREFNDITAPDREEISEAFAEIFKNWWQPLPNGGNWNIIPIPDNVSDLNAGSKVGAAVTQLLLTDMPEQNKIWLLVYLYGFNEPEARQMVPPAGTFTPVNPKPVTAPGVAANDGPEEKGDDQK